jgi:predicted porin
MKKSLLAMAVAGAVAAVPSAQAVTTLYGQVGQTLSEVDSVISYTGYDDFASPIVNANGVATYEAGRIYSATRVHDNVTKLGVKGSEDLGNGLTAVYQIEYGLELNNRETEATEAQTGLTSAETDDDFNGQTVNTHNLNQRNTFVGLKGGFGTALIGRHDTPAKIALGKVAYAILGSGSGHSMNHAVHVGFASGIRANNVLAYISPNLNGFTFALATVAGEQEDVSGSNADVADNFFDGISAALMYSNGPLYAALGYTGLSGEVTDNTITNTAGGTDFEDVSVVGLALKYAPGPWEVGYLFENSDAGAVLDVDRHFLYGAYAFGSNKVYLHLGMADGDWGQDIGVNGATVTAFSQERTAYGVAFQHKFSKRTSAWLGYTANDNDFDFNSNYLTSLGYTGANFNIYNGSILSFGLVHKF